MEWLASFVVGWFGSHWWPGQEYGAPNPKDPRPWEHLVVGILAGIAAIYVVRATGVSDPMPGLVLGIATGCVAGKILGGVMGMMRKG